MNNTIYCEESLYFEMDSNKTEIDARIYDNIVGESATPGVEHTSFRLMSSQGSVEKRQATTELENARQSDAIIVRRMLLFMSAVAVVALVVAAAALFLAAMKSGSDSSANVKGKHDLSVSEIGNLYWLESSQATIIFKLKNLFKIVGNSSNGHGVENSAK